MITAATASTSMSEKPAPERKRFSPRFMRFLYRKPSSPAIANCRGNTHVERQRLEGDRLRLAARQRTRSCVAADVRRLKFSGNPGAARASSRRLLLFEQAANDGRRHRHHGRRQTRRRGSRRPRTRRGNRPHPGTRHKSQSCHESRRQKSHRRIVAPRTTGSNGRN